MGCSSIDGDIPKKKEVLRAVKQEVPSEKFTLEQVDKRNTRPKEAEYFFKTKERGIEFQALSTLTERNSFGSLVYYAPVITVNYAASVHNLYREEAIKIMVASPYYNSLYEDFTWEQNSDKTCRFDIDSYEDIEGVAETIVQLSQLYRAEENYNDKDWMRKYPLLTATVKYCPDREDKHPLGITLFKITGYEDFATVKHEIELQYAIKMQKEEIPYDEAVPQHVKDLIHKDMISNIYVNGRKMEDDMANSKIEGHYNNGKNIFAAYYNYDMNAYTFKLDVGINEEKCNPHPLQAYVQAVDGTGGDQFGNKSFSWTIGEDKFTLKTTADKDTKRIQSVEVKKNGESLPVTPCLDTDTVGYTYLAVFTIDDIAAMFNLSYEIDEENDTIFFKSK